MAGKVYMILGGGGSFAIHLAHYLLDHASPEKVIGVGRNPLRPEPFSLGIDRRDGYEYYQYHLVHEFDLLTEFLEREQPHVIVNFAAQGEGAVSWKHSWRFFDTNATALVRLVEWLSARDWLERFVQISTSELYGSVRFPATEDDPIRPTSPYAASKAAFDMYLLAMHQAHEFPMNILRPSNAYCSGQLLHRVVPRAIVRSLLGVKMPLHGGGKVEKSYIHAIDLARAIYYVCDVHDVIYDTAAKVQVSSAPYGAVYNVGPRAATPIHEVVARCARAAGTTFEELVEMAPGRAAEDARYLLDSSRIARDVCWSPRLGWDSGLDEVVYWARSNLDKLRDWPQDYQLRS